MKRLAVALMLVFTLTTGVLVASEVVHEPEHADAFHGGWHPTWGCMAGTSIFAIGAVSTAGYVPNGVDWRYLWGKGLEAYGAWMTLTQCIREFLDYQHAHANACVRYPSYTLRVDSVWLYPGFWWQHTNWRSMPCVVNTR